MFSGDAAAVQDADPRLNCDPSTLKETKSVVIHMNIGKSPERFDIYAKIFERLARRGVVPVWKGKCNTQECGN